MGQGPDGGCAERSVSPPDIARRFVARIGAGPGDIDAARRLRALCFGAPAQSRDPLDDLCTHVLVEDRRTAELACSFRMMSFSSGAQIARSYAAQFYDLSALARFDGPMIELGRFCIHPGRRDPDILRAAWAAMTRQVDATGVELLFGCTSFSGTDENSYLDAFALLKDRHLAPHRWRPRVKAPQVFRFAQALAQRTPDMRRAVQRMPPLLRTYLMMGGWVSDHAVIDADLDTLHVFTGVEVGAIPEARKRLLRQVAR